MASGDTKTEAMLNALGNGGSADEFRGCCNTKTQQYILDAIDRVQNVEDEVEELKNNPDVVDIVDTYADLQAYDTQHLTENDIIRVLQDETHSGNSTYYRFTKNPDTWTFIGEVSSAGGAIELTSADYDYPDANPTGVALWRKPAGVYWTKQGVKVYLSTYNNSASGFTIIVANSDYNYYTDIIVIYGAGSQNTYKAFKTVKATGAAEDTYTNQAFLLENRIQQTTGTSTTDVMSQNAVTSMMFADPSNGTKIQIGQASYTSGASGIVIGKESTCVGNSSVVIGRSATTAGANSVAIGRNANATRSGEVNIGAGNTFYGYNGTSYRILGGVHDPVDNHDAATKGYVDANAGSLILYAKTSDIVDQNQMSFYSDAAFTTRVTIGDIYNAAFNGKDIKIISKNVTEENFDKRITYNVYKSDYPKVCNDESMNECGFNLHIIGNYGTYMKRAIIFETFSGPTYYEFVVSIDNIS